MRVPKLLSKLLARKLTARRYFGLSAERVEKTTDRAYSGSWTVPDVYGGFFNELTASLTSEGALEICCAFI